MKELVKHLNKAYREIIDLKHENCSKKYVKNYDLYVKEIIKKRKDDNMNLTNY